MGRNSTGAITTREALRLELSFLITQHYFQRGKLIGGVVTWNSNWQQGMASIEVRCSYPESGPIEIHLHYKTTDHTTGAVEIRNDLIRVEAIPSNLGKGEVLYFLCPQTGKRCRILYRCYGSSIWKSQGAYQNRIYYPSQKASVLNYHNERFWQLDAQIERLRGKRGPGSYRGKPTRRAKRLEHLYFLQRIADVGRWRPESMILSLRRALYGSVPGYESVNQKAKRA